jgi:Na+-transporting methylmalonyl-CoA/oxaloacetate decarboxylase gamma subunit
VLSADNKKGMFSKEFMELLIQVVQSWQVIAVTIALVLFMYLVGYVARSYHRPRSVSKSKPKKVKTPPKDNSEEILPD